MKFKKMIELYFGKADQGSSRRAVPDDVVAKRTRSQLNLNLEKVKRALLAVDISPNVPGTRRTGPGQRPRDIDLVEDIFSLHQHKISPQTLVDHVERAVGIYRDDRGRATLRTINPLYWLSVLLDYAGRLPSFILVGLGMDRERFEGTALGDFLKGSFRLALLLALGLVGLHYAGLLDPLKSTLLVLGTHLKTFTLAVIDMFVQATDALLLEIQELSSGRRT
jgi:hypothetical protein